MNPKDGLRSVPHDRMRVRSSVIDVPLWNRATWRSVFYAVAEEGPPLLALGFADGPAATMIWQGWMSGRRSLDEFLQISIVTSVNKFATL